MNLRELVDAIVAAAYKLKTPRRIVVRWALDGGGWAEREIEDVWQSDDGESVLLVVPRPAQFAGEPGAGDVIDESDVTELDVDLVLAFACGERGCSCPDGRCMTPTRVECRERLKREQLERIREGERCRVTGDRS